MRHSKIDWILKSRFDNFTNKKLPCIIMDSRLGLSINSSALLPLLFFKVTISDSHCVLLHCVLLIHWTELNKLNIFLFCFFLPLLSLYSLLQNCHYSNLTKRFLLWIELCHFYLDKLRDVSYWKHKLLHYYYTTVCFYLWPCICLIPLLAVESS